MHDAPESTADAGGRGERSPEQALLLLEMQELARAINLVRTELAAMHIDEITGSQIPLATDELDAVVEDTAAATNTILECCETFDRLVPELAGPGARLLRETTTRIYEACGFQDITGQRITKVVATLKAIEARVRQILQRFDVEPLPPATASEAGPTQASLVNGPRRAAASMDQSDVDRLLASFPA